jgi:RNA polymerase sigma factor for flagellar operon FliA
MGGSGVELRAMKAMVALKERPERLKRFETNGRKLKARLASGSAKVIRLHNNKQRRRHELSPLEQEKLVLDFRVKARKLGRSILRKWHARLDLEEVDSVVDLSLCEAVRRFNPRRGASFITFLFYHLRGNLIRAVAMAAHANAVPLSEVEAREENHEQQQSFAGLTYKGANAIEIAESLCGGEVPSPDEALLHKELREIGKNACLKLDALEQEVIRRIYLKEERLISIASELGYSRCHISRVKKKALETLLDDLATKLEREDLPKFLDSEELKPSLEEEKLARRAATRRGPRSRRIQEAEALRAVA